MGLITVTAVSAVLDLKVNQLLIFIKRVVSTNCFFSGPSKANLFNKLGFLYKYCHRHRESKNQIRIGCVGLSCFHSNQVGKIVSSRCYGLLCVDSWYTIPISTPSWKQDKDELIYSCQFGWVYITNCLVTNRLVFLLSFCVHESDKFSVL